MKANELRIGNWVNGNRPYQVNINVIATHEIERKFKGRNYCEPIPLTEEWLVKFGFERSEHCNMFNAYDFVLKTNCCLFSYTSSDFSLGIAPSKRVLDSCDFIAPIHSSIIHVHQLQNLFHALTGTELILSENDSSSE